jgi:hypothetical protein
MVLSSGSWPFQQCLPLTLPTEVNFKKLYFYFQFDILISKM